MDYLPVRQAFDFGFKLTIAIADPRPACDLRRLHLFTTARARDAIHFEMAGVYGSRTHFAGCLSIKRASLADIFTT